MTVTALAGPVCVCVLVDVSCFQLQYKSLREAPEPQSVGQLQ